MLFKTAETFLFKDLKNISKYENEMKKVVIFCKVLFISVWLFSFAFVTIKLT